MKASNRIIVQRVVSHSNAFTSMASNDRASPVPHLRNKQIRLFPRRKMPSPLRLIPVYNVFVVALAPLPRRITIIAAEPTHPNRQINCTRSRVHLALPVKASGGCARVRQPVQHDRVEHLVFAEDALDVPVVVGPVAVLLVDPGGLCNR
jgi:hypothetical protein